MSGVIKQCRQEDKILVIKLRSIPDFTTHRDDIEYVFNKSKIKGLYTTSYEFLMSWLKAFEPENIHCFIIKKGNIPVAFAPLQIVNQKYKIIRLKTLKLLGNELYSRNDILINEERNRAFLSIAKEINKLDWDVFSIGRIHENSIFRQILIKEYKKLGSHLSLRQEYNAPCIDAAVSFDSFIKSKSANFRRNIKRLRSFIAKNDVAVKVHTENIDMDKSLSIVEQIEKNTWKYEKNTTIHSRIEYPIFYKNLVGDSKNIKSTFIFLYHKDKPIAYQLTVEVFSIHYMLKCGFDSSYGKGYSPGAAVLMLQVERVLDRGGLELDFDCEVGGSSYKSRWMTHSHKYYKYLLFNNKALPLLMYVFYRYIWQGVFDKTAKKIIKIYKKQP